MSEMWDIYPASFDDWTLNNVSNVDPNFNIEKMIAIPGGSLDPGQISTAEAKPEIKFDSMDVQAILAQIPLMSGRVVTSSGKIQYIQRANGGAYVAGSNHLVLSTTLGCLYVDTIETEQSSKDGAKCSVVYHVLYDGNNAPVNVLTGQALAGTPAVNALHALGPVVFEGTSYESNTKLSFKSGIEFERAPTGGVLWSKQGCIKTRNPELALTFRQLSLMAHNNLSLNTTTPISQALSCYLVKKVPGGGNRPFNASEHLKIVVTSGTYTVTKISGQSGSRADVEVVVNPTQNGISVSTASTIP